MVTLGNVAALGNGEGVSGQVIFCARTAGKTPRRASRSLDRIVNDNRRMEVV